MAEKEQYGPEPMSVMEKEQYGSKPTAQYDPEYMSGTTENKEHDPEHTSGTTEKKEHDPEHTSGTTEKKEHDPEHTSGTMEKKEHDPEHTSGTTEKKEHDPEHTSGIAEKKEHDPEHTSGTTEKKEHDPEHTSGIAEEKEHDPEHTSGTTEKKEDDPEHTSGTTEKKEHDPEHTSGIAEEKEHETKHTSGIAEKGEGDRNSLAEWDIVNNGDLAPSSSGSTCFTPTQQASSVRIVVTGQLCTGKTTLVKELVGELGNMKSINSDVVHRYESSDSEGNRATIFDIDGLNDPTKEDDEIIREIVKVTEGQVDLVFFCINMRGRVGRADVDIMKKLTEAFNPPEKEQTGKLEHGHLPKGEATVEATLSVTKERKETKDSIWLRTVFVLTFANEVDVSFEDTVDSFKMILHKYLRKIKVPDSIVETVRVLPAGRGTIPLLNGKNWLLDLVVVSSNAIANEPARNAYHKLLHQSMKRAEHNSGSGWFRRKPASIVQAVLGYLAKYITV